MFNKANSKIITEKPKDILLGNYFESLGHEKCDQLAQYKNLKIKQV